jgi:hypothetical protein
VNNEAQGATIFSLVPGDASKEKSRFQFNNKKSLSPNIHGRKQLS